MKRWLEIVRKKDVRSVSSILLFHNFKKKIQKKHSKKIKERKITVFLPEITYVNILHFKKI